MSAIKMFELAFSAGAPSGYFSVIQLLAAIEQNPHAAAQRVVDERVAAAQEAGSGVARQLARAGELARDLEIDPGPLPRIPAEYTPWLARVAGAGEGRTGFTFGRDVGETSAALYALNETLIVAHQLNATTSAAIRSEIERLIDAVAHLATRLPEGETREVLEDLSDHDWLDVNTEPLSERLAPLRAAYEAVRSWVEEILSVTSLPAASE